MFGELNGGDSMMETLGLQFKDKIYDDMKTDEHGSTAGAGTPHKTQEKRTVFIFETEKVKIKFYKKFKQYLPDSHLNFTKT